MSNLITVKSPREIEQMRVAGRITAEARSLGRQLVAPGITTQEINKEIFKFIKSKGATPSFLGYGGFPGSACISVNDEVIHGIPGDRKIQDGDIVSVDVGVWHDGFVGDNAKTVAVNVADPAVLGLLANTERALMEAVAAAKSGARLGDVSHAVERVANASGISVVREFVGHGCGRSMHEEPQIPNYGSSGRGPLLKPGMVLCIEPMLNLGSRRVRTLNDGWTVVTCDGKPSAHFEHMIAITPVGAEILTPREPSGPGA